MLYVLQTVSQTQKVTQNSGHFLVELSLNYPACSFQLCPIALSFRYVVFGGHNSDYTKLF